MSDRTMFKDVSIGRTNHLLNRQFELSERLSSLVGRTDTILSKVHVEERINNLKANGGAPTKEPETITEKLELLNERTENLCDRLEMLLTNLDEAI